MRSVMLGSTQTSMISTSNHLSTKNPHLGRRSLECTSSQGLDSLLTHSGPPSLRRVGDHQRGWFAVESRSRLGVGTSTKLIQSRNRVAPEIRSAKSWVYKGLEGPFWLSSSGTPGHFRRAAPTFQQIVIGDRHDSVSPRSIGFDSRNLHLVQKPISRRGRAGEFFMAWMI